MPDAAQELTAIAAELDVMIQRATPPEILNKLSNYAYDIPDRLRSVADRVGHLQDDDERRRGLLVDVHGVLYAIVDRCECPICGGSGEVATVDGAGGEVRQTCPKTISVNSHRRAVELAEEMLRSLVGVG